MNIYSTNNQSIVNNKCDFCNNAFKPENMVLSTQCQHNFHIKCLSDRIVEQGNTCPKCQVAIKGGGMLQIPKCTMERKLKTTIDLQNQPINLTSTTKIIDTYENIDIAFNDRNFEYLQQYFTSYPYKSCLYKCNKIILEDIQNQQTENIINTLKLLYDLYKNRNDKRNASEMLTDIVKNTQEDAYKNTILDIFAEYFASYDISQYVLTCYIKKRDFTKAQKIVFDYAIIPNTQTVSEILSEDINNNNIDNIKGMLHMLREIFSRSQYLGDRIIYARNVTKNLETSSKNILNDLVDTKNIGAIQLFLEYGVETDEALIFALSYYINQKDFSNIRYILDNFFYVNFPLDVFFTALTAEIEQNNISDIDNFLQLANFISRKNNNTELKKNLESTLNAIISESPSIPVVEIFFKNGIQTKEAINFTLKNAIETENYNHAKNIINEHYVELTSELLKPALQKNIHQQNIANIDALLKLRKLQNEAELYKMNIIICDLLKADSTIYSNINIIDVFLDNNIALEQMKSFSLKYHIQNKNESKAREILSKLETDTIVNIFKELLQQDSLQEKQEIILYYIELIKASVLPEKQQNLTQRLAEIACDILARP